MGVRNFTIFLAPNLEQSAVLECEIQNKENVNVWVNWTSSDGEKLKNKYSVVQDVDVFFFVLYNVTQDNVHEYTCQLFSTYSPEVPEDQKTAEITSAGQQMLLMYTNNSMTYTLLFLATFLSLFSFFQGLKEKQKQKVISVIPNTCYIYHVALSLYWIIIIIEVCSISLLG